MKPVVGFVGMTHLGLVSAGASAAHGLETVCYDPDGALIGQIQQGDLPVIEPDLPTLLRNHRDHLTFTSNALDLKSCQVVYVSTDVPTDDQAQSDLSQIHKLCETVTAVLEEQAILVILCQIPPGFTRHLSFAKERLFYQVETLIFGRAVERAMSPERFIVGCFDPTRGLPVSYQQVLNVFECPILLMRYESAELAKLAINCCLASMVTVTNTLAELSERIGADWSEVVPALQQDKRIGAYAYLSPGLGIAGGNLERDLTTIGHLSEKYGTEAGIVRAWLVNSRHRRDWVLRTLHNEVLRGQPNAYIGILGLAYKENTHSTKNSPALALIRNLTEWNLRVFDPVVPVSAIEHPAVTGAESALQAAIGVDVLVIMTPWPIFKTLNPGELVKAMSGRTVIDPYRVLDGTTCVNAGLHYFTLGLPPLRSS